MYRLELIGSSLNIHEILYTGYVVLIAEMKINWDGYVKGTRFLHNKKFWRLWEVIFINLICITISKNTTLTQTMIGGWFVGTNVMVVSDSLVSYI